MAFWNSWNKIQHGFLFPPNREKKKKKLRQNGTTENMSRDNAGVGVL